MIYAHIVSHRMPCMPAMQTDLVKSARVEQLLFPNRGQDLGAQLVRPAVQERQSTSEVMWA